MADVDGLNSGYARLLLEDYLENPDAVPSEWRTLFESGGSDLVATHPGLLRLLEVLERDGHAPPRPEEPVAPPPAEAPAVDEDLLGAVAAGVALVKAYRTHGHLAAHLDPLGSDPVGDPALDPASLVPPLPEKLQHRVPAAILRVGVPGDTLADVLDELQETYCGTIAYEIEHISNHEERVWLRKAIESGRYRRSLSSDEKEQLLARLTEVEGLERYLHRTFLGQKSFSIEGLDVLVPMLDEAVDLAAESGAHEVVIGMAHRGRLNVLAHVVGLSYEEILREFEGERTSEAIAADPEKGSGDVKYHHGRQGTRTTKSGDVTVTLAANPSHLEAVDPVVEGWARAEQTDRSSRAGVHDPRIALPVLIHGDAAFPAQGVVAETLNVQALAGYTTGGTLHVIANNQIGFTTDPEEGRSTRYSSDLAKGFDIPIIHVNADDAEASLAAVRLALAYRTRFAKDVLVDLVGYRRWGHNEQDEPAYTQPLMAEKIASQPTARDQLAGALAREGVVDEERAKQLEQETLDRLRAAHERLTSTFGSSEVKAAHEGAMPRETDDRIETAVSGEVLRRLNGELLAVREDFTIHPKLAKQLERRDALDEAMIDWGHAEELAFASLLTEGIPIRLTGQDTERGTFSQRHLVLHDARTGERYVPIQNLDEAQASFEVHNSPLSELAAVGFEYGYSASAPEALVLWEAQFGDFVNGAQVILDQFLVSGLSKWGQTTRLTLLLPHGYEGNGPEHSSARLERFLQLAAEGNIRVANPTTAAQYFHLLRRQALNVSARPLIVMTPKGLLRLREAASRLDGLVDGAFQPAIDDPDADHERVRRLVFCSGKLYYDLLANEHRSEQSSVAIARLEQLYPFPVEAVERIVDSYPNLEELVWAQEEPQNMGAWRSTRHRLEQVVPDGVPLRYIGRSWRASTSEGYPTAHAREQGRIVAESLGLTAASVSAAGTR
jgi:2-oxoglutarate dehydrogenase E1 component